MTRDLARTLRRVVVVAAVAALLVPAAADAQKQKSAPKPAKQSSSKPTKHRGDDDHGLNAVYTATNDPTGNAVVVYNRRADGTINQTATVSTGGKGLATEPPFGFPIVDSSGSINLTSDGRLLFVVNAGDNTVSSFRVNGDGLKLVDREPSGGILPVSLSSNGHLLYVVNELSGNIFGYRFSPSGKLDPIVDSEQSLSIPGPNGIAASIGFAPNGRVLVVTERFLALANPYDPNMALSPQNGVIDTFTMNADGTPNAAQGHTAATPTPFGFTFTGAGHLLTSSAGGADTASGQPPNVGNPALFNGSAQSYNLTDSGAITPTSNAPSHGRATCWIVATKDGRFAFGSNTLSGSNPATIGSGIDGLSRFAVAPDGTVTFLGNASASGAPGFPSDEALSNDSKYLYLSVPSIFGGPSHIEVWQVGATDGSLTRIQSTPNDLPNSASGIAAY